MSNSAVLEKPSANTTPAIAEKTVSQSFVEKVQRQFIAVMGDSVSWTDTQRALAQNLYVKADAAFAALEVKRSGKDTPEIIWANINMNKFCIDATRRIILGLDALLPNHLHFVPYLNGRTQKYDVDLRIGYEGALYWRTKFAAHPISRVKIELVHDSDEFRTGMNPDGGEWATVTKTNPFSPGAVIGAYGWIIYVDQSKNFVHIVEAREFVKAQRAAKSQDFWGTNPDDKFRKEMQFKTAVFRVANKIPIDTTKINSPAIRDAIQDAEFAALESVEAEFREEVEANANGEMLSLSAPEQEPAPAPVAAPVADPVPVTTGQIQAEF